MDGEVWEKRGYTNSDLYSRDKTGAPEDQSMYGYLENSSFKMVKNLRW